MFLLHLLGNLREDIMKIRILKKTCSQKLSRYMMAGFHPNLILNSVAGSEKMHFEGCRRLARSPRSQC